MRRIIGIDPGPERSGIVSILDNLTVIYSESQMSTEFLKGSVNVADIVVIEDLSPRQGGSPGQMFARWSRTIQTAKTIGAVRSMCRARGVQYVELLPATWRAQLCGAANASDAQIKACVRSVYEERGLAIGGGKQPAIGIKKQPGPLYTIRGHAWDALGVALAWLQTEGA